MAQPNRRKTYLIDPRFQWRFIGFMAAVSLLAIFMLFASNILFFRTMEAIERAVDYDDWFVREVEKGLAQIEAGQVLTHEAVADRLEQKLANHKPRR